MQQHGSRWDETPSFGAGYYLARLAAGPGQRSYRGGQPGRQPRRSKAKAGWSPSPSRRAASDYKRGDRVFHIKFGYGAVTAVEGNKLTVAFEKAGEKKVIDSFVERG